MSVSPAPDTLSSSRLMQLTKRGPPPPRYAPGEELAQPTEEQERCELCDAPIPSAHRHMLELSSGQLLCVCRACAVLFDREGSGGARYKLLPERRLRLTGFRLSDLLWERLAIPVEMAFFFDSSAEQRVLARYPGPIGPVESKLELGAWDEIQEANPVLFDMQQDVEALLVNRTRGARQYWLVPLDDCYALVGLIRTQWRGLGGGKAVWQELERFFAALDDRAQQGVEGRQQ